MHATKEQTQTALHTAMVPPGSAHLRQQVLNGSCDACRGGSQPSVPLPLRALAQVRNQFISTGGAGPTETRAAAAAVLVHMWCTPTAALPASTCSSLLAEV